MYKSRWLKTFCVDQGIFNLCEILLLLPLESCGYVCDTMRNSTLFSLFLIYFDSFSKNFVHHVLIIFNLVSTTFPQSILISTKLCILFFCLFVFGKNFVLFLFRFVYLVFNHGQFVLPKYSYLCSLQLVDLYRSCTQRKLVPLLEAKNYQKLLS